MTVNHQHIQVGYVDSRMQGLDDDTDHPAKTGANSHRGHKDTARDFTAIRNDDEPDPDDGGQQERVDHLPLF